MIFFDCLYKTLPNEYKKRTKQSNWIRTIILSHKNIVIFKHPFGRLNVAELFLHLRNLFWHHFLFIWRFLSVWIPCVKTKLLDPVLFSRLSFLNASSYPSTPRLNCIKFGLPILLFGGVYIKVWIYKLEKFTQSINKLIETKSLSNANL